MCTYKILPAVAAVALALTSCLKNDIPYPRIQAGFTSIECEHMLEPASVDSINRTVTFFLDEEANPRAVRVTAWTLSPAGAEWPDSTVFAEGVDLTSSRSTYVSLYQEWHWSFMAVQTIERTFAIENQIGAATIDVAGRRVVAQVPKGTNMTAIRVTALKLGGATASYEPDLTGQVCDFSEPVTVAVTEHDVTTCWDIYVVPAETNVNISRADAWTRVAWVYAEGKEGSANRMEYRKADAESWTPVPDEWLTIDGGTFTARLIHLDPLTAYQVRAFSDDEQSAPVDFTTEDVYTLPDANLDSWWQDGKVWCPWPEGGEPYWGTGNKGAATLGQSNTVPTDDTPSGSGLAACLETRFVGIASIGKLAAGNLFAGTYVRTEGTNGVLAFGRPFTLHPTRLTGWYKYTSAVINYASTDMASHKGEQDQCIIWCALIDASEPFEIRTNPANRRLFNPDDPMVVAYGAMQSDVTTNVWQKFDVELKYKDTRRTPKYILITASASWLGDYFTGGTGACLWVDDFGLGWDY